MAERDQMLQQKTHSLLLIGIYTKNIFQMTRNHIDAYQRYFVFLFPVALQSVFADQGDHRARIVLLDQFQIAERDQLHPESGKLYHVFQ